VAGVVGDDVVTWDSRLSVLTPGFELSIPWATNQVTLRDLFCHRSGLPDHGGDLLEDLGFGREEILHRLRYLQPSSSFRSAYAYTNFGLTAAAVAAAAAAETDWEDLAARRLYRPLGMARTSSRFADFMARTNRAIPHMLVDGIWMAKEQRDPDAQSPAGGVSSSASDLARWMRLQLDGGMFEGLQIINADALAETHRPQIVTEPAKNPAVDRTGFYGLGWGVGTYDDGSVRLSHSGAFNLGAGSAVYLAPGSRLGIIVLTNASPVGAAETVALSFIDLALRGRVSRDWWALISHAYEVMNAAPYGAAVDYAQPPASATPPLANTAYTGSFGNELYGGLDVAEKGGGLALRIGPAMRAYPLTHYDRDVFTYQPVGENAYGPSGVTFAVGPDGTAARVTLENLDQEGQGTFTRAGS
jgi:CubicO group peptidase (beta-lactamase class C family)